MKQEQPFELGQRVTVHAYVRTGYTNLFKPGEVIHDPFPGNPDSKKLFRTQFQEPRKGIIVGYTWRATGRLKGTRILYGHTDDDPLHLVEDKRHKVWLIAENLRWEMPIVALEADIECGTGAAQSTAQAPMGG